MRTRLASIISTLAHRKGHAFAEALMAELARRHPNYSSFGYRITGADGKTLDIHPYSRLGASALCIVICQYRGEPYLLMGGKKLYPGRLFIPGGYVDSHPPGPLPEGQEGKYDQTLEDTARRELFEETDLRYDGEITFIGRPLSDYSLSKEAGHLHHSAAHFVLMEWGTVETLPTLREKDDLTNPEWIPVRAIEVRQTLGKNGKAEVCAEYNGMRFFPHDTLYIDNALHVLRRQEFERLGVVRAAIVQYEMEHEAANGARYETPPFPLSQLGAAAQAHHLHLLSLVPEYCRALAMMQNRIPATKSRAGVRPPSSSPAAQA